MRPFGTALQYSLDHRAARSAGAGLGHLGRGGLLQSASCTGTRRGFGYILPISERGKSSRRQRLGENRVTVVAVGQVQWRYEAYKLLGRRRLARLRVVSRHHDVGDDWDGARRKRRAAKSSMRLRRLAVIICDPSNNYTNGTSEKFVGESSPPIGIVLWLPQNTP